MPASQTCKKLQRKRAKTYDKSKKSRNTAVVTFFANQIHCYNFLKCFIINLHEMPSTGAKSKTLIWYI